MRQVRFEAVAPFELLGERLEDGKIELGVGATAAADQVLVARGVCPLILGHTVVEVRVAHNAELLEDFEGPVHGGDIDVRKVADDSLVDLVGGEVPMRLGHHIEDQLALWCHAQAALSERDFQLANLEQAISRSAPYHSSMSTSPSEDSGDTEVRGEILKASAPGAQQIEVGMDVASLDGERIGKVKEVGDTEFLLDRPLAHDLWVPFSAVLAAEDYTTNFRGPVDPLRVVLSISEAHINQQDWRRA